MKYHKTTVFSHFFGLYLLLDLVKYNKNLDAPRGCIMLFGQNSLL